MPALPRKKSTSSGVYRDAVAVSKSDSTTYTPPLDGFYVGGIGDVAVVTENGETVIVVDAVGFIPLRAYQILSTGTDATGITGFR